jgi:hypothetical protein
MTLNNRIKRLEESIDAHAKELIVFIRNCGEHSLILPDPRTEIMRQRAEGNRVIVVDIPEGYDTESI